MLWVNLNSVYCPMWQDVYKSNWKCDGAFWTTSLPHLFFHAKLGTVADASQ